MRHFYRALVVVLPLVSLAFLIFARGAQTVPLYAARTGNQCQTCHFDPNGGGARNDFGFAYARKRHSMDDEPDSTSLWHDLNLTNKIGDTMPVYFGLNYRMLLIGNSTNTSDSLDRLGFFQMENALHVVFQPHSRLTFLYSTPGDAWGMIGGFPWNSYLKAGSFRVPFGLRMDDHTVASRNSFLDFGTPDVPGGSPIVGFPTTFLPYDPRFPDQGVEAGFERSGLFGRGSFTNGAASPVFGGNTFANTEALKLGYATGAFQVAASFYDSFDKNTALRATRWGVYGMTHYRAFAVLGELAAGTDDAVSQEINKLAGFGEVDWSPERSMNFRARVDVLRLNRGGVASAPTTLDASYISDANSFDRYALEGEFVPVPFAEIRWVLRLIDHKVEELQPLNGGPARVPFEDERQVYLQVHFSY